MRFELPPHTLARLREVQALRPWPDDVVANEDAFLLDPGLGPALYLTADGRVLVDGRAWDPLVDGRAREYEEVREATDDEATVALVVGAKKTGVLELLALLPAAPPDAQVCSTCAGTRWAALAAGAPGPLFVCMDCHGRGWTADSRHG